MIAGRHKNFTVELPDGCRFVGKIIPPDKKANLPGEYWVEAINHQTGGKKRGQFHYRDQKESVRDFLQEKLPGWQITKLKQTKITLGKTSSK